MKQFSKIFNSLDGPCAQPRGRTSRAFSCAGTVLSAFALGGCASTTQFIHFPDQSKPIEDPEKARIYVIRSSFSFNIASQSARIYVADGAGQIGYTTGHGYLCWERGPGQA